jgi:transcriptional regulator GlxA family with amidase domain
MPSKTVPAADPGPNGVGGTDRHLTERDRKQRHAGNKRCSRTEQRPEPSESLRRLQSDREGDLEQACDNDEQPGHSSLLPGGNLPLTALLRYLIVRSDSDKIGPPAPSIDFRHSRTVIVKILMLAFPGVQLLDVAGPFDVFAEAGRQIGNRTAYGFELVALDLGPLTASNGIRLLPDATLASASEDADTLLVAGNPCMADHERHPGVGEWLRRMSKRVRRIGSVCSGAFVLAHAGLLDGKRATTHWNSTGRLAAQFPAVRIEADSIFVKDGAIYTSAGVTAGMDLALALVEEDFGRTVALKVARELVMFLKRPGGQSQFSAPLAAQTAERSAIRDVQNWVLENLSQPLSVEELARRAGMSTRNFARSFRRETQWTPAEFVERARLDSARRMLEETKQPMKRIASVTGFGDATTMRRAFLRRIGVTPVDYRRRF